MSSRSSLGFVAIVILGLPALAGAQEELPPDADEAPPPPPPPGGMCISVAGSCGEGGSCDSGGDCFGGLCVNVGVGCDDTSDCGETGQCIAIGNPCEGDEQCDMGFACQFNLCVMVLMPPPPDGVCDPNVQRCPPIGMTPDCMVDEQCAGGTCRDHVCSLGDPDPSMPSCEGEACPTATGTERDDVGGAKDGSEEPPDGKDVVDSDMAKQQADEAKAQALQCSIQAGASGRDMSGLGLLLALSTLFVRRARR